jgi:hypothetical protein
MSEKMKVRILVLMSIFGFFSCTTEEECRDSVQFEVVEAYGVTDNSANVDVEILKPTCPENIGFEVSQGVYYSEDPIPTKENSRIIENFNPQFTATLNLEPNKTYYYRAFFETKIETFYSATNSFKTIEDEPVVSVYGYDDEPLIVGSSYTSVILFNPYKRGDYKTLETGICWSKTPNPTTEDEHIIANESEFKSISFRNTNITSGYKADIMGLDYNTIYYVRGYVKTSLGTFYSEQIDFQTQFYNKANIVNHFVFENGQFEIYDKNDIVTDGIIKTNNASISSTNRNGTPNSALNLDGDSYVSFENFKYDGDISLSFNFRINSDFDGNGVLMFLGEDIDQWCSSCQPQLNKNLILEFVNNRLKLDINYARNCGQNCSYPSYNREILIDYNFQRGTWYNVILTQSNDFSPQGTSLYLNGVEVGEIKMQNHFNFFEDTIHFIGAKPQGQNSAIPHSNFKGDIDDIIMWSTRFLDRFHIPYLAQYGY